MREILKRFTRSPVGYQYLAILIGYLLVIWTIPFLSPAPIPKLEEGIFIDNESGRILKVKDNFIYYAGESARYNIWIAKGKRYLSTTSILSDMYLVDVFGKKVPAKFIIDNEKNAHSMCSVRFDLNPICFNRTS